MSYETKTEASETEAFETAAFGDAPTVMARPPLSGAQVSSMGRKAFAERYLRKGLEPGVEVKRLQGTVPGDGGLAVPVELDAAIGAAMRRLSPIRAIANVVQVGSSGYRKLMASTGFASGWVGEAAARPETNTPTFVEVTPPSGDLYANPAASQGMLDDAAFDIEAWLADEIAAEFARAEAQAFVSGTGVARPKGFITYNSSVLNDTLRAFGILQHIPSGTPGNLGADAADRLVDLVHALSPGYRQNATFVMNSNVLSRVRKLKEADGSFLWRPSMGDGPATLLGYPVVEADAMPDIAASANCIAFGDFRSGYLITERAETGVLRDPYSNKPFVHFYATRRIGGAVVDSNAIKMLRID